MELLLTRKLVTQLSYSQPTNLGYEIQKNKGILFEVATG